MSDRLEKNLDDAVRVAKSLFERGKTAGSSANLSFRVDDKIWISGTGTCFGTLQKDSFSVIDLNGNHLEGIKPSKEFPLHLSLYQKDPAVGAVLHTHSFYATLWSCYTAGKSPSFPHYTPYLRMKLGDIGFVPYAPPGSPELFAAFSRSLDDRRGYLLQNHGPIVASSDLLSAFYALEELEESAHLAWELRNENCPQIG